MMKDRNGYISIEFKDVHNCRLDGDFTLIPKDAIMTTITETIIIIDELENLNRTASSYRVILGKPIYRTDEIISANDIMKPNFPNELPIMVVGEIHGKAYYVFSGEKDKVVSTREEFINTINEIGAEFLEKLDNSDASLRLKI